MNIKTIFGAGALVTLGAIGVDIHSWSISNAPFDWKLALKRYVATFVSASIAAATGSATGLIPPVS